MKIKRNHTISVGLPKKLGAKLNPFSTGRINQVSGARFEAAIKFMGIRHDLMIISNGLKAKRYADKVVAEKSNLDFLILGSAAKNEITFADAKAFAGARFGRSMINPRQLALCREYEQRGFTAGFIVLLKKIDYVGFYSARTLCSGKDRAGFGEKDGLRMGTLQDFDLTVMWK